MALTTTYDKGNLQGAPESGGGWLKRPRQATVGPWLLRLSARRVNAWSISKRAKPRCVRCALRPFWNPRSPLKTRKPNRPKKRPVSTYTRGAKYEAPTTEAPSISNEVIEPVVHGVPPSHGGPLL